MEFISNLNISPDTVMKLFSPFFSAQMLNAYYSALLIKQGKGIALNKDIEAETMEEVFSMFRTVEKIVDGLIG